jgi:hypothetical protein
LPAFSKNWLQYLITAGKENVTGKSDFFYR